MNRLPIYIAFLSIIYLPQAFAGQSVCPDGTGGVQGYASRGNPIQGCLYFDAGTTTTQAEYDRIKTLFKTVPQQHIKIVNNSPEEMTASEKTAVNDAMAAEQTASIRSGSKNAVTGFNDTALFYRALVQVLLDEINILRADIDSISKQSSQITDLNRPARTLSQARTAIENKIDGGSVDS